MPEQPPTLANGTNWPRRARGPLVLLLGLFGFSFSSGCLYHAREATDETVNALAAHPYDLLPTQLRDKSGGPGTAPGTAPAPSAPKQSSAPSAPIDDKTDLILSGAQQPKQPQFQLTVPDAIPGSEVPRLTTLPADAVARQEVLRKVYQPLPALPEEVKPLPGPGGKPYTLSDLQRIAAENSPTLKQAASDVQAALGVLRQAAAYPNPNAQIASQASNNNSTAGSFGGSLDQVIVTGGKIKLAVGGAKVALDNSELALKRARSDLATQVRNAYFALLAAKETMRVTRALSVLTDEVYRVQLTLTEKGFGAAHEPATLRAQAYTARLAYMQARETYILSWKQLVAAVGVRQLPLTEVEGRIDSAVPYYDYDQVLARILQTHTDALTARNALEMSKYSLKLNQIAPWSPNLDVNVGFWKDRVLYPIGTYGTFSVTTPIPIWDQNRGNILSAEAAFARALEEPHRVELVLTTNLASAYTNYKTNLDAVEYYRRYILPDQVLAYRGVFERRQVDLGAQFADLVAAQQALSTSVTTYLNLLGTLWSSVVSVADLLQTDDLFQNADPVLLPALPDLEHLPALPCCHPFGQTGANLKADPAPSRWAAPVPAAPAAPPPMPTPSVPAAPTPWAPAPVPPVPAPAPYGPRVPPSSPGSTGGVPSVFYLFFCNANGTPTGAPPDAVQQTGSPFATGGSPDGR